MAKYCVADIVLFVYFTSEVPTLFTPIFDKK
jgi:hypothetical protein